MLPRTEQDVDRRLRLDVLEGEDFRVLIDEFRRNFLASDFAEQAIVHERSSKKVESRKLRVERFLVRFYFAPSPLVWSSRITNV